jgi:hypothetical protein
MTMKLALGFAAALSLLGTAGAGAETIYVTEPAPVLIERPNLIDQGQYAGRGLRLVEPGVTVIAREPGYAVVAPPSVVVAPAPSYYADRLVIEWTGRVRPYERPAVEVDYVTPRTCVLDAYGFRRCY